jgi:membrane protein
VIGLATLAWSASNVFAQLQEALNTIWEVEPKPGQGLVGMARKRMLSMTMVLGIGFLLLVSLVLSAGLAALGQFFGGLLPGAEVLWHAVDFVVSLAVTTALFAAIYKVLPDAEIAWGDVWVGAAVTAVLFALGKVAIGLYLGHASVGSTYGVAGSLLVLLVWIYYSAQILFFGAEFTQVYARRYGSRITPSRAAVPLTVEARANQGVPPKAAVERAARTGEPVATAVPSQQETAAARPATPPAPGADAPTTAAGGAPAGTVGGTAQEPGVVKKLLWTGLAAGSLAVAGMAARRISAAIWGAVLREPPPSSKA